jgi:hypothetical protein
MTEREWLRAKNPTLLFDHLQSAVAASRTKQGRRRLHLVACGCCRLVWDHLTDPRAMIAIETAERFADGEARATDVGKVARRLEKLTMGGYLPDDPGVQVRTAVCMAATAASTTRPLLTAEAMLSFPLPLAGYCGPPREARALIADLIRDIFGNPFRPQGPDPTWRTSAVTALARQMYDAREFSAMPILADALQDAGCDCEDILNHCRAPGVHVRGCWVVDLVSGKE